MRKSTLARIVLFCYGLNCISLALALLVRHSFMAVISFLTILFASRWLENNYFDVEEITDDKSND